MNPNREYPSAPPPRAAWLLLASLALLSAPAVGAQQAGGGRADPVVLSLAEAQARALRASRSVAAVREAAAAAAGRARQASAFPNPVFSYTEENANAGATRSSQGIVALEQPIEPGLRAARHRAAALREDAAGERLRDAERELRHVVARAFARVLETDRRAALAADAASVFVRARRASDDRFAAGDISGYAHGRVRLEAARYVALGAEARLERERARLALVALLADGDAPLAPESLRLDTARVGGDATDLEPLDTLVALALATRPDLLAERLAAEAAQADTRLAERERIPTASLTAGMRREELAGVGTLSGIVLGVRFPLPLWDRRAGATEAARADSRAAAAGVAHLEQVVQREVREAHAALRAIEAQLAALTPELGAIAGATVRAAETAYAEGEITLVEWLDAVRAHQETEGAFAALRAESIIRRSALERAIGLPSRSSLP